MTIRNLSLLVLGVLGVAAASDPARAVDFIIHDLVPMARAMIAEASVLADRVKDLGTRTLVEFSILDRHFYRHMAIWGATLIGTTVRLIDWLIRRRHAILEALIGYANDLRKCVSWLRTIWTLFRIIFR